MPERHAAAAIHSLQSIAAASEAYQSLPGLSDGGWKSTRFFGASKARRAVKAVLRQIPIPSPIIDDGIRVHSAVEVK